MACRDRERYRRRTAAAIAVGLAAILLAPIDTIHAFHEGGVGSCKSCHIMHPTKDGVPIETNDMLLLTDNATDICLTCHATANGSVLGSDPLNPPPEVGGGNFVYLLEDNINDAPGGSLNPISGNHAGHNVVSLAWGIQEDPDHPTAPGGSYPSSELGCTSCHDPHGNGNFRMLYGAGQVAAGDYLFLNPAPLGDGIPLEGSQERPDLHTAYNQNWSV